MAHRKPRGRRRFTLRKVRISNTTAIGALAALDVIEGSLTNVATEQLRVISLDLAWSIGDLGATQDDGQEFGVAHSDYTAAEIEECLEATGSLDPGDKLAEEKANRLVRSIGQMQGAPGTGAGKSFKNGEKVKTRLNWLLSTGDSIVVWIRNGSGAVYTTGASLVSVGEMWVKDSV